MSAAHRSARRLAIAAVLVQLSACDEAPELRDRVYGSEAPDVVPADAAVDAAPPAGGSGGAPAIDLTCIPAVASDALPARTNVMERGRGGEVYNVASGNSYSMEEVLQRLLALAGVRASVEPRPDQVRPREVMTIRADAARLRRDTGWAPHFSLDQTLTDTLAFWRRYPT